MVENNVEQLGRLTQVRRNFFRIELEPEEIAEKRQLDKLLQSETNGDFLRVFLPTICGAIPQERTLVLLSRFKIPLPDTILPYSIHFEDEHEVFLQAVLAR